MSGTLVGLFAASAGAHRDAVAVSDDRCRLTYAELDACSDQLARELAARGVGPEDRVGVFMERSTGAVAALLGILKAGAAYVAMDARSPAERRDFMLADSGTRLVVTQPGGAARLSGAGVPLAMLEWAAAVPAPVPAAAVRPRPGCPGRAREASAACVLYTSGSTGTPKGIVLEHRQLCAFATNRALPPLLPGDRVAQVASITFDSISLEIWAALAAGAEVVCLPPIPELMAADLQRELRRRRITVMLAPAVALNHAVHEDPDAFAPLRILHAGGDVLLPAACRLLLDGAFAGRLFNLYGPAEISTACTAYEVREVPDEAPGVPIGTALDGVRLYVLGPGLEQVPRHEPGELYVAGSGVARGYLGRPGATAARFLPDHLAAGGGRMYATGDLVRENAAGDLEFLGRIDDQVKIRGNRVEPGEVERALRRHPDVREAWVLTLDGGGDVRLVAFLVPADESVSLRSVRQFMVERVPEFMVPPDFVVVPALPVNAHGKRDRDQAIGLLRARVQRRAPYAAPRTEVERYLAALWEELLSVERVGAYDDFFALGGHSLLTARVRSRIERELGVGLPVELLFENAVLEDMARAVEDERRPVAAP